MNAREPVRRMVLILVAGAVIGIGVLGLVNRAWVRDPGYTVNDFMQDYVSARAHLHGQDPYAPTAELANQHLAGVDDVEYAEVVPADQRNPHPPSLVVLTVPLTYLPYPAAHTLWLLGVAGATAAASAAVARRLGAPRLVSAAVGIGSLALPIVQSDLIHLQINGLLVGLVVVAWLRLRAGRDAAAGIALGIASALKLFPLFLLIPLLRTRRWRAIAWQLSSATVISVTAAVYLGTGIGSAVGIGGANLARWAPDPSNVSLVGIPFRWLTTNPWLEAPVDAPTVALVTGLLIVAGCGLAAYRTPIGSSNDVALLVAVPWMLLAGPLTWTPSLVIALPFVLLVAAERPWRPVTLIGVALLVIGVPPGLPAHPGLWQMLVGSALPTCGLLLLAWSSRRARSSPAVRRSGHPSHGEEGLPEGGTSPRFEATDHRDHEAIPQA